MLNKGVLFSQVNYSTSPIEYNWLQGDTSQDGTQDKIYGKWGNIKVPLLEI